jgi:hypothetical protein
MSLSLMTPALLSNRAEEVAHFHAYWDEGKPWDEPSKVIYRPPITVNYTEKHKVTLFYSLESGGKHRKMYLDPFLTERAPKGWYGTKIDNTIHFLLIKPYGWDKQLKPDPQLKPISLYLQEDNTDPCFARRKGSHIIAFSSKTEPDVGDKISLDAAGMANVDRGVYWVQNEKGNGYKVTINGDHQHHGIITGIIACDDFFEE